MKNTRFATSLHILTLLNSEKNNLLASDYIAGSINVNPVIVRKEISNLLSCGLVISKEGKNGGYTLARPADKIRLSEIYDSIRETPLLGRFNNTNPACPVGRTINKHVHKLFDDAEAALVANLYNKTLAEFCEPF